jgi:hypothetical protein
MKTSGPFKVLKTWNQWLFKKPNNHPTHGNLAFGHYLVLSLLFMTIGVIIFCLCDDIVGHNLGVYMQNKLAYGQFLHTLSNGGICPHMINYENHKLL